MRHTRDPRVWFEYGCWSVQNWMQKHQPLLPIWLRSWAYDYYGGRRYHISPALVEGWKQRGRMTEAELRKPENRPLPWPFGPDALGPFVGPWGRVRRAFARHTGGRSHRCEFTDPRLGALYGHKAGPFMDAYFDRLLETISED